MQLVDNATGQLTEVPDEHVADAFRSGKYGFQAGKAVPTVAPDGTVGTVAPEHVQEFLEGGGRIAPAAEYRHAELEAKHGGVLGGLAAAGEGAARGLSLGLSDPLAVHAAQLFGGEGTAEKVRTHLEEEKEAHPWLAGGSEVLGAAAPILLTGGAAAPEEAGAIAGLAKGLGRVGALPRGAGLLGDAAEHTIGGLMGAADTTLGRAGQAAAKTAVRAIVEGGLFGAGQEVSESTLEDSPLTAEKMFHAVGHSALTAGLLGGAAGALGKVAGEAGQKLFGGFSGALEDASGEQAWKWLNPGKKLAEKANARAGGTESVGKTIFEEVLRPLAESGGLSGVAIDDEAKLGLVRQAIDRTGGKIGDLIGANDSATVKLGEMLRPIDDRLEEWAGKIGGEDKVASLERLKASVMRVLGRPSLASFEETAAGAGTRVARSPAEIAEMLRANPNPELASRMGADGRLPDEIAFRTEAPSPSPRKAPVDAGETRVPLADAIKQRRSLQQIAYDESKSLDPQVRVQLLRDVSREWGDLEERALNDASKDAPSGLAGDQLRSLNKRFQQLKIAEEALETSSARHAANRNLSLSDYLAGAAHAPSLLLGGHPGGALGAVASSFGHRWLREHGNAYASLLLDRLATMGEASRAAKVADEITDGALTRIISGKSIAPVEGPKRLPRLFHARLGDYEEEEERVRQLAAVSPELSAGHLGKLAAPIATHLPQTSRALAAQSDTATRFLASKLPPAPMTTMSATPHLEVAQTSDEDKVRFLRYTRAVEDGPPGIVRRMAAGQLHDEDLEVLEKVYPRSLAEIRTKASSILAGLKKPPSYDQRLTLSRLLGRPLDATMTPDFASFAQHAATMPAPPPPSGMGPGKRGGRHAAPPKALSISKTLATPFEVARAED